ncbi:head-tail connector protein [Metabacillus litoralis]|uniref:head-tail connector protein n=1 Tax=Metabacillus litoralis TaxID=152268 RepID=UPI00203EDE36|nr:head-tail connector protein [Metabacillus litoralis]MCM3411467.1 head-tail connector protein [Metabacillus litoralis]
MTDEQYIEKLRQHIHIEEGVVDPMLSFYIQHAKTYVQNATGKQTEYLVILVAGIFYEYRVAEKELKEALDAITPFFLQEVISDAETPS